MNRGRSPGDRSSSLCIMITLRAQERLLLGLNSPQVRLAKARAPLHSSELSELGMHFALRTSAMHSLRELGR